MVHIAALKATPRSARMAMHLSQAAQIAILKQDKAPTEISFKYTDYAGIFSFNVAIELAKNTDINKHAIELQDGK